MYDAINLIYTPNPRQLGGGVFFMKYSWEFKLECVEKNKKGIRISKPDYSNCDIGPRKRDLNWSLKYNRVTYEAGINGCLLCPWIKKYK